MSVTAYLLGAPLVVRDGTVYAAPKGRKAWALLAYLALSDRPPTRQQLVDLLFPDAEDPAGALRWNLSELRPVGLSLEDIFLQLTTSEKKEVVGGTK